MKLSLKTKNFLSKVINVLTVVIFMLFPFYLNAQIVECIVDGPAGTSSFGPGQPPRCNIANSNQQDYAEIAIYTISLNFHFVADDDGDNFHCNPTGPANLYAPDIVDDIISFSNSYFTSPQINAIGNPGQVHDARIRVQLYSISGTTGDPCGGIFFHNNGTTQATIENHSPYGDDVVDVIFRDGESANEPAPPFVGGNTRINGLFINVFNMLFNVLDGQNAPWNYFRLTDTFGKQLKRQILTGESGTLDLDISDLPNGLYLSSLYQNGELIKSLKLIVKN